MEDAVSRPRDVFDAILRRCLESKDFLKRFYDLWLECLIEAVSEFDPNYSPAIEKAWRKTMQTGIYHMRAAYEAR